ncbi:MAG: transposase, partial [Lacisediminimonas sp.]|nr:transposase [Lacisediminimonas sp.]
GLKPDLRMNGAVMTYNDLRKGRVSQIGAAYHITAVARNRTPHFSSLDNGRKVVRELMKLEAEGRAETLCYLVMPDHLHWLMVLHAGKLADAVHLLKGRSARAIGCTVWQPNYFDHAVRQDDDLRKIARYIVANPLRANLVERIGDYPLWDAVWLDETLSG